MDVLKRQTPVRLNRNQLKLTAALTMVIDHAGASLFPQLLILRVIGRLAFPIFAYFIYEGCRHTKDRRRYVVKLLLLGIVCMAAYYMFSGELFCNVLITFTLSAAILSGLHRVRAEAESGAVTAKAVLLLVAAVVAACALCAVTTVDYGLAGVLLPVAAELSGTIPAFRKAADRLGIPAALIGFTLWLGVLSAVMGGLQYFCLLAAPLLALYGGENGKLRLNRFFYWFYPAHLALIGAISLIVYSRG